MFKNSDGRHGTSPPPLAGPKKCKDFSMKNGIQGLPPKIQTFQDCANPVIETWGNVTPVILKLNLFATNTPMFNLYKTAKTGTL